MDIPFVELSRRIGDWATTQREVGEVWLFGSRARGNHNERSDVDLAIIMAGPERDKGERLGDWLFLSSRWETELSALLPWKIDLDIGDSDISDQVVAPALKREGIRLYPCEAK